MAHSLSIYPEFTPSDPSALTRKDFVTDQDVRWCPGCGDYSILAQVQRVMPSLGIPREKIVFVSGIGCSSRFPYYMETFGIHSIHGRAPALATGIKSSRPDLSVWLVTGDGDGLSIGGNHFIHVMRRNVDIKMLMFNNQIYGLTKGQYSPTSPIGKKAKSTPMGSVDYPLDPISIALGANATFVARTIDVHASHQQEALKRVAAHKGTAFLEIYQNCNIFNDGAFDALSDKATRPMHVLELEHGKPMRFGKDKEKGIVLGKDMRPQVVHVDSSNEADLLIHDETSEFCALLLSRFTAPEFPVPIGVFRAVVRESYDALMNQQVEKARAGKRQSVQDLLDENVWTVK
ncbi:MAG TPA: 2-oxoacid:ferredoxin oxidoreductase subunit beta [Polyangiales bacterium]|nr:2-oxoacid:ferredoxin oxidoreductase subunit beta [Polyangiales bacterium]